MPVPEAEDAVGALRLAHDPSAARGAPAHITILMPFVPPEQIDEDAIRELVARYPAFDFSLDRIQRFEDGVTWLRPEPTAPFVDLTEAVWQRWPEHPPYEGEHDIVIPHLTVSLDPIDLQISLPIAARAREVLLLEEQEENGRWVTRQRFPLS